MLATDLSELVRSSGRSWWEARFASGRVVTEWEMVSNVAAPPRLIEGGHWDELAHTDLVGVRLLCPDGTAAELASKLGARLFQFKVGGMAASAGATAQWCSAHVIGAVVDASGACACRAWETFERRLVTFEDNVFDMRYRSVGPLALEHLGVRV